MSDQPKPYEGVPVLLTGAEARRVKAIPAAELGSMARSPVAEAPVAEPVSQPQEEPVVLVPDEAEAAAPAAVEEVVQEAKPTPAPRPRRSRAK